MKIVKVQKIPKKEIKPSDIEDLLAAFCYYYPQYTFNQARKLPYKRIRQMLKQARKEKAKEQLMLLDIVVSPHTDKGKGILSVRKQLNDIIDS